MSSKRSALSVGSRVSHPCTKRSKTSHLSERDQTANSVGENRHINASSSNSRLSLLKTLVEEATNDLEIAEAEPKIAQAISMLYSAFQDSHGPSVLEHESRQASQGAEPKFPTLKPQRDQSGMPSLPPIQDILLQRAVFMHPACGKSTDASYDRLEVLGDAYIELIATKLVWERFPGIPAGRISQIREGLVKNETLAKFAEKYGFDHKASVPATYSDQPKRWVKTKGDIFEAYVAAVVLSDPQKGYGMVEEWLIGLWSPLLDKLGHQKAELRSKEELAKRVMGKGIKLEYLPERDPIQIKGSGTQMFFIGVYLTGWGWEKTHLGSGQGSSKVEAGDEAARAALLNTSLISQVIAAKKAMTGK
ncbi:hypothetical protein N7513_002497 [Penicillium frequentans]|nr:hypothetical protein N7513_002497 [Penicillium glabrum]